jgi:tRNA dimethylallyltransferase
MNKVIIILGQTSTGKSDFAVQVAKELGGEVISADSRQVYKGLNLGTGKITKKEMRGIPHHLLDISSTPKIFTVFDFQKNANIKIKDIIKRGKIPIICGGTAFYINSLTSNVIFPKVLPNKKLRTKLEKKSKEELYIILKILDKKRVKTIDKNNKVRLIRAIEIAESLGQVPSLKKEDNSNLSFLKIGLKIPNDILKEKINSRLISRIEKGLIKEVNDLHKKGLSWQRMNQLGLEYRYVSEYLQNVKNRSLPEAKLMKNEMIEKLNSKIWQFAKRQNTWWKKDKDIFWINPQDKKEIIKTKKFIKDFLNKP